MARKVYFTLDSEGLINALSYSKTPNPDEIECEVEDDHEVIKNPLIFRYREGKLLKDVEYQEREIKRREFWKNKPSTDSQLADLSFQLMNMDFEVSNAQESVAAATFELMNLDSEVSNAQNSNADLIFQLMMKGVI